MALQTLLVDLPPNLFCMKFSHPAVVFRCQNTSLLYYQNEIHFEYGK